MKRTLSLILSLLMVLSLFTGLNVGAGARVSDLADTGADAEIADTGADTIYSVAVTGVIEPVAGAAPTYYASVPSDKGYQVENYTSADYKNGVAWYNYTDEKYMTANDTFVSEKQYIVYVYLKPADNSYSFASNVSVTLNGKSASFTTYSDGTIEIYRAFTCPNVPIDSVEVTGVVEPIPGAKPSYTASVPSGTEYQVSYDYTVGNTIKSGVEWFNNTDLKYLTENNTFEDGKQYTVTVYLKPASKSYSFASKVNGTLNGIDASILYYSNGDISVYRTFTCKNEVINSVEITDVIAPMPGAFANTSCTIPSGCGYKTRYNYYDGVTWYTEEGDILSHGVDKFVGGKKYTAQIALTALDGYVFSDSATGTINGTNARVRVTDQRKTLYVNLTFTCPKAITAAECAVTDPVAGEKPNYTAVSGDSGKYSAEIINWFKGSGDRAEQMASRESFEAGNTYSVRVRYTAQDGFVFDENTVYTVNGQSTTYLGRGIYEVSFTVINPNQPKPLVSVSCTVTKPIAGQKPNYTAVPADSTKYSATVGSWIYGTGRTARTMSDDEEFIEGKTYQVQVKFTANRGYYLTDDTFCIINGKAATKVTIRGEDYYVVIFTAEAATTAVTEFSVTNIMEPVAGQSPYYYAAVPAGKGYLVDEDFTDGTWVNGVLWHNDTVNKDMTENDTFEEDKQYTVTVLLDSTTGYSFASNVSGTLNGENAEVISYGDRTIGVYRSFTCTESSGSTLSGTATSYLSDTDTVTIQLLQSDTVKYSTTVTGKTASYSIPNVANGSYTLLVSKNDHVTRDYSVTVSGNTTQNVKIHPKGDISGDGRITSKDFAMAYAHAQKLDTLTGYALKCGDVVKNDGQIKTADAARIYAHAQKLDPLW